MKYYFITFFIGVFLLNSCTRKNNQHVVMPDNEKITDIKGVLDTSFNNGKGYYISPPFSKKESFLKSIFSSNSYSQISVTGKLTNDNKILILGNTFLNKTKQFQIYLAQHNIDGSLDTDNFGNGDGYIIQDHFPTSSQEKAFDFVQLKNGQILIPGVAQNKTISTDEFNTIFLTKFNSNGDLDLNFGNKGVIFNNIFQYGFVPSMITSAAMTDDSHMIFAGSAEYHHGLPLEKSELWSNRILMGGFDFNRNIFSDFGNKNGIFVADQLQGNANELAAKDYINIIKSLDNGKIILGGRSESPLESKKELADLGEKKCCYRFILSRYNSNGTIDKSFGLNGYAFNGDLHNYLDSALVNINSITFQNDRKILVAGYFSNNSSGNLWRIGIARFNENGSIDKTFGKGGYFIKNNGDIVDANNHPADKTFGEGGYIYRYTVNHGQDEKVDSIALEGNGKFIAAITSGAPQEYDHLLFKYTADGKPELFFPNLQDSEDTSDKVGDRYIELPLELTGPSGNFNSRVSIVLQKNGKLLVFGITNSDLKDRSLENARYFIARYK